MYRTYVRSIAHGEHGVKGASHPACLNLDRLAHRGPEPPYPRPVGITRALGALLAAALLVPATPALAMTPRVQIPGWNPADPPSARADFDRRMAQVIYRVSCGEISATGWSADALDDEQREIRSVVITTASAACFGRPGDIRVWRDDTTLPVTPFVSSSTVNLGFVTSAIDVPYIDWDFVPTPRIGQWVAIAAAAADGAPLPIREQRITVVDADGFVLDAPIGEEYVGAPVVDNQARVLGVVTDAGTRIAGTPRFCPTLFGCTDPTKVWWDITAPSVARDVKATPGKGRVTVTWKAAASDGGDAVTYSYSVNGGPWVKTTTLKVTVKARKGQRVTVAVGTVNLAGAGPTEIVSAKAR
jgi:hypothetical protein